MFYSIGTRLFDDLQGTIVLPSPHHETEHRAGQNGLSVHATGVRGREFELISEVHTTTWADAHVIANTYHLDPSLTPVNIIRLGVTYFATVYRFVCLRVSVEPIEEIVAWSGLRLISNVSTRVYLSPAYRVRARWTLIAVDTSLPIGFDPNADPDPPPPP